MHEKQPVVFYNLCDASVTERKDDISKSYSNESEARFVLHLYSTLVTVYPKCADLSVAILTPYNEQKALVRRCTCISFVVPKVHCRAVRYDGAETAGVDWSTPFRERRSIWSFTQLCEQEPPTALALFRTFVA